MTWTYNGDPANSSMDAVRFLVGDTDSNDQLLQNEEINYLVSAYPGVKRAAAKAARTIAAKFARFTEVSSDDFKEVADKIHKHFLVLATRYDFEADTEDSGIGSPHVGGISVSQIELVHSDTDRVSSMFLRGKFKNYRAQLEDEIHGNYYT